MASRFSVSAPSVRSRRLKALNRSCAFGALALACAAAPQLAFAQDECGAPTGSTVTCTSAGNPYPNGITYIAPPQDLTIVLDPDVMVDTSGTFGIGVLAVTDPTHSITISGDTGASIFTSDPGSFGVLAGTTAGDATVNMSNITTTGDAADAIFVATDTGTANVSTGTAYTYGDGARGVSVYTGTGTINASGFTIVTNGDDAAGFNLNSQNGDVNLTLARGIFGGTVLTYGAGSTGIYATAGGAGNVSITGNGPNGFGPSAVVTQGDGATGVQAQAQGGNVLVDLSQVQTTGAGSDAIVATSTGGGVTVNAQTVTADDGRGVVATGNTYATVTQSGNFIGTGGDNHNAVTVLANAGPATATIGTAFTGGANSNAVDVRSPTGMATANVGGASTQGDGSVGVLVDGATSASATVGSVHTYGDNADGVDATSTTGVASATNNGSIQTEGMNSRGIYANGGGGVTISGTGSVTTHGDFADGIYATSANGPISVTSGDVTTSGDSSFGIAAFGGTGTTTVNAGNVTVTGAGADAIIASSDGDVSVAATSASSTNTGSTVVTALSNTGDVDVNVGATTATGADESGILAFGAGNVTVTSGTVDTGATGGSGIYAASFGTGDVSVANMSTISGGTGITAMATDGSAAATVQDVSSTGAGVSAVVVNGSTTASARVLEGGTVSGNVDGIDIISGTGSTVMNAGTIDTGTGYAIRATGGAAAITNTGTINGRILLTAGDDSVRNAGTFNVTQNSEFGDGTDSFTNSGMVRVLPGAASAGTESFTGLESFANSGTVDLRNGHTGDVFNLGTASFAGSGGSTLALDVQLGGATPSTDLLRTGAATGSTQVVLDNLTTGAVALNPGLLLVQGTAGSSANAFTLAGGSIDYGFANYNIVYNATDFGYRLVGAPSQSSFRTLKVIEGARNLWYKSADAWSAHMTELRDATWRNGDTANNPGSRLWLQMYGSSNTRRDAGQSFSNLGVTTTADLGYKQDVFGGQIGLDFGSPKPDGGLVFGITGGYANSTLGFDGSPDHLIYNAANVGLYAGYVSGAFFVNALGKYDHYWIDSHLAGSANTSNMDGNGYGGQAEAGFRFGGTKFFAEPVASIAYVKTDIDALNVPGFSFDFNDQDGLRGKAGLRIGSAFSMGGSSGLVYASGMAVHEFQGRDQVTLLSGGQTLTFQNDRIGTYGQGTIGFNITSPGGVTGFIEGFGDYSDQYRGGGGRAGLRIRF
jgi:outer membrane autotransporter protein